MSEKVTVEKTNGQLRWQSFRDLHVWQRSMELTTAVYRLTQAFPREETFGLVAQLRRSAISVPSNLAEGHGRMNPREFKRFLLIARGSNCELQTQLEVSAALGFGRSGTCQQYPKSLIGGGKDVDGSADQIETEERMTAVHPSFHSFHFFHFFTVHWS